MCPDCANFPLSGIGFVRIPNRFSSEWPVISPAQLRAAVDSCAAIALAVDADSGIVYALEATDSTIVPGDCLDESVPRRGSGTGVFAPRGPRAQSAAKGVFGRSDGVFRRPSPRHEPTARRRTYLRAFACVSRRSAVTAKKTDRAEGKLRSAQGSTSILTAWNLALNAHPDLFLVPAAFFRTDPRSTAQPAVQ